MAANMRVLTFQDIQKRTRRLGGPIIVEFTKAEWNKLTKGVRSADPADPITVPNSYIFAIPAPDDTTLIHVVCNPGPGELCSATVTPGSTSAVVGCRCKAIPPKRTGTLGPDHCALEFPYDGGLRCSGSCYGKSCELVVRPLVFGAAHGVMIACVCS